MEKYQAEFKLKVVKRFSVGDGGKKTAGAAVVSA